MRNFFITVFTPLARRLPRADPDTITLISFVTGCTAGTAFLASWLHPVFYLLAGLLVGIAGACDSLDGIVARMYNRASDRGDFLDHFCDIIIDICILTGLAFSPGAHSTIGLLALIVLMLNYYLGTQIQASFGKRYYIGLGKAEFVVALILFSLLLTWWGNPVLTLSRLRFSLVDVFFLILTLLTLSSMLRRLRFVRTLMRDTAAAG